MVELAVRLAGVGVPLVPVRRSVRQMVTGAMPPSAVDLSLRGRVGRQELMT